MRRRKKWRTRAVKTSCLVAAVMFFVSACMLDSLTWVPFVLCCLSISWLGLVAMANDRRKEVEKVENRAGNLR